MREAELIPEPPNDILIDGPPIKEDNLQCKQCHSWLPMNGRFFDHDRRNKSGFRDTCKQCRAEERKVQADKEILKRIGEVDAGAAEFLEKLAAADTKSTPELRELAQSMMHAFGGAEGFAKHYLGNFLAAKPGSTTRQKALDRIMTMMEKMALSGKGSMDDMTDDEIRDELASRIERAGLKVLSVDEDGDEVA